MRQCLLDLMHILTQPIKFTQALLNAQSFIHWQRLNTE